MVKALLPLALLLAAASGASGFEATLERYWQALARVCGTGVTPELVRLWEATVEAVDKAGYGGARASNFWGPRHPDQAYQDCVQAPGWE